MATELEMQMRLANVCDRRMDHAKNHKKLVQTILSTILNDGLFCGAPWPCCPAKWLASLRYGRTQDGWASRSDRSSDKSLAADSKSDARTCVLQMMKSVRNADESLAADFI